MSTYNEILSCEIPIPKNGVFQANFHEILILVITTMVVGISAEMVVYQVTTEVSSGLRGSAFGQLQLSKVHSSAELIRVRYA